MFVILLRISLSSVMTSDGANNALQAWDILHGNVLLHGWIIGDATYYTFELPQYAMVELFVGLRGIDPHLVAALTYLIVAGCGLALARTGSSGAAAAARSAVVVTVLATPLVGERGVSRLLESPDHIGTSAILLACFLLIDRAPGRRFTASLLGVILCAGQLGDATVRYIAVPAVIVVCGYRVLAARKIRSTDAAIALAAAASVPLALVARAVMLHFGAYAMVPPPAGFSPLGHWPQNALLDWQNVISLFGAADLHPGTAAGTATAAFGLACLLAATAGFGKVLWTWRRASLADQLVCVTIILYYTVYVFSSVPPGRLYEIAGILPCGAVLAARACVPGRFASAARGKTALVAAALVALLPLAVAASRPPAKQPAVSIAAWLEAHGLRYGIAGYWDASAVTLQSGDRVQVRAVRFSVRFVAGAWEAKPSWYNASQHDATFVIADPPHAYGADNIAASTFARYFGRPVARYWVGYRTILIYRINLLKHVVPGSSAPDDRRRTVV